MRETILRQNMGIQLNGTLIMVLGEYNYGKNVFRTAFYLKIRPFFKGVSFCLFTGEHYWSESDLQKMIIAFEDNSVKIVR